MATDKECEPSTSTSVQWSQPCRDFELSEILLATENFAESLVIGHGGFGKVYRGIILNGSTYVHVAIKRLDSMSNQGAAEFWAEVEMLSKLRHCHLVSLFGYCNHGKEMILVYEYMPNRTLEDHLHKLGTPLSWIQRINICIGAARGLHYLHTGTGIDSGVIHRDVKSSNILLHESWAAKISDFGLSRIAPTNQPLTYVNTIIKGTFGYFDPDYYSTGRLTRKSDVYAFGVVLLEILCRKRAVDSSLDEEQWNLARWVQESIKEGNLKNIIDSDIRDEISPKCLKEFVRIAERCLLGNPKQRSTMAEVVVSLESVLTLQEKVNSSLHPASRTIFGRVVDKFPFSNGETSARGAKNNSRSDGGELPADNRINSLKEFKFADLKKSTSNFSEDLILGQGAFGQVFLGWVDKNTFAPSMFGVGIAVAVKRLHQQSRHGHEEWQTEVNMLGQLAHPNIISLLGYCCHERERLLVYEYMQKRSFDLFLHRKAPDHITEQLSWGTRLTILIGVARGLAYLHSSKVIYRCVKSGDILLDQDLNSKLGDFGLVKTGPENGKTHVSTEVRATVGFMDPDYLMTGHLSVKSDIYGFGMVLLETLTGLKSIYAKELLERYGWVDWASIIRADKGELRKIIDPHLEQHYPEEGVFKCTELALRCLDDRPKDRPSSDEVLQTLEQIYALDC